MKKTTFLFLLGLFSLNSVNAQFTVTKFDGTALSNNQIIEFTTHSTAASELKFVVQNNATENLDFRIRCMNLVNNTGSNFQLCWGFECIPSVSLNGIYPDYQNIINAGANTNGLGDSFKNSNGGDGTNYPMDYSFRIFTRDLSGNPVGSNFNITYRYQGPLSLEQQDKLSNMGVKVLNTQVDNFIGLEISKQVNVSLINIQGQTILSNQLNSDTNLDLSSLPTGVYFLNFNNNEGFSDSVKIYKK
jgi:hypothetical protein